MTERMSIHTLVYGESGSGKSTFAATFPKPMLVFMFDPFGKEIPYLKQGKKVEVDGNVQYVMDKDDNVLVQVERYIDADPENPGAYGLFAKRLSVLHLEYDIWATVVLDSVTYMEIAARLEQQFKLNKNSKDPRQWYAASTEKLEQVLMIRFSSLPMNVVCVAHVDDEKDVLGTVTMFNPAAPGRMRKRFSSGYSEFYRQHVIQDEKGERHYVLQTQADNMYNAMSHIDAPNPCWPTYEALWENEVKV